MIAVAMVNRDPDRDWKMGMRDPSGVFQVLVWVVVTDRCKKS